MSLDVSMTAAAAFLLADKGRTVVLKRHSDTPYDTAASSSTVSDSTISTSAKGYLTEYTARDIDGTLIKAGDIRLILDPAGVTSAPRTTDTVEADGQIMRVMNVNKLEESGSPIVYICQCRKM